MTKEEIVKELKYLESKGVAIRWEKRELLITGFWMLGGGCLDMGNTTPTKPLSLTLYTNRPIEENIESIQSCLNDIREYDDYIDNLKDNEDMLEIKRQFETKEDYIF